MPDEVKKDTNVAEEKQPEELSASEQTQETTELPSEASERTKEQFDKLKAHNRELADRLRRLEGSPEDSVFDSLRPQPTMPKLVLPNLTQNQVEDISTKLVDENGYIDQNLLVRTLKEANDRATKAETEARRTREDFERMQENEQVKRAHKLFPQLDPKSTDFDPKFYEQVKDKVISTMVKSGTKDLVQAANDVAEWYPLKKEPKESKETEQQVRKIQANAPSQGVNKLPSNQDDLVRRTQMGDSSALMERLKRAGY